MAADHHHRERLPGLSANARGRQGSNEAEDGNTRGLSARSRRGSASGRRRWLRSWRASYHPMRHCPSVPVGIFDTFWLAEHHFQHEGRDCIW